MLPRLSFVDPVRVCEECSHTAKREEDFFEKHLKTLCSGEYMFCHITVIRLAICKLEIIQKLSAFSSNFSLHQGHVIKLFRVYSNDNYLQFAKRNQILSWLTHLPLSHL